MSVAWLREKDGTLLSEIADPVWARSCSWKRRGAGEVQVDLRSDPTLEPCLDDLLHDSPVEGRFLKTWWDTDIELAVWRDGTPGVEPTGDPTWAGPIVAGAKRTGWIMVRAYTQDAYLLRSAVGDVLVNYLITDGASEYDFSVDTDLSEWTTESIPGSTVSATTTTGGSLYTGTHVALLEDGYMYAYGEVPTSENGNYAFVGVAVLVPAGVSPIFFDSADGSAVVGDVDVQTSLDGMAWADDPHDQHRLTLPSRYLENQWYPLLVQVPQPADVFVRYKVTLYGGDGDAVRFARPKVYRPANVGATAGVDISQVPAAILDEQADLLGFTYDVDPVGVELAEPVRYFAIDHEQPDSALGDFDGHGEWRVRERLMEWAPSLGEEITDLPEPLSNENVSGWEVEVDATQASSILYAQIRPEDGQGPADQVVAGSPVPNRLVAVEQVPAGMGPSDAVEWSVAALASKAPAVRLTGTPAVYEGLPGDLLGSFMPGNWMDVDLDGLVISPTVDQVTWDPRTDRVVPSWILGGQARRDPLEMLTAQLKAAERERRKYRPKPMPDTGRTQHRFYDLGTSDSGFGASIALGPGLWTAFARSKFEGDAPNGGNVRATVYSQGGTDTDKSQTDLSPISVGTGASGTATSSEISIEGPVTVSISAGLLDPSATLTVTNRWARLFYTRIG